MGEEINGANDVLALSVGHSSGGVLRQVSLAPPVLCCGRAAELILLPPAQNSLVSSPVVISVSLAAELNTLPSPQQHHYVRYLIPFLTTINHSQPLT